MKICLSLNFAIAHVLAILFFDLGECLDGFTPIYTFKVVDQANKCGVGRALFENGHHYPHYVPALEDPKKYCDRKAHLRGIEICVKSWRCFHLGTKKPINTTGVSTEEAHVLMDLSEILCNYNPCYETAMHKMTIEKCDLWNEGGKLLNLSGPSINIICRNMATKFGVCAASLQKILKENCKCHDHGNMTTNFIKAIVDGNMTMNYIKAIVAFDLNKQILIEKGGRLLNHMPECKALLTVDQKPPPLVICGASTTAEFTFIWFSYMFVIISVLLCSYTMHFLVV